MQPFWAAEKWSLPSHQNPAVGGHPWVRTSWSFFRSFWHILKSQNWCCFFIDKKTRSFWHILKSQNEQTAGPAVDLSSSKFMALYFCSQTTGWPRESGCHLGQDMPRKYKMTMIKWSRPNERDVLFWGLLETALLSSLEERTKYDMRK